MNVTSRSTEMKIKKEKKHLIYTPPPQFTPLKKPSNMESKELWIIQIPPGIKEDSLNGKKFKLKNNKLVSLNENTEMLIQKTKSGHVIAGKQSIQLQGQITLRHKIEIPILNKPKPIPATEQLPCDLKYRLSRE